MSTRPMLLTLLCSVALSCSSILGIEESEERNFEHRAHLLEGVACTTCHKKMADEGRGPERLNIPDRTSCLGCHEKPHDEGQCSDCHGRADNRFAVLQAKRQLRFSHDRHDQAADGQCVRCHTRIAEGDGPLRPAMHVCLSCHQHRDQWGKRECGGCHVDMEAEGTRPQSHVVHGPNFMKAHGTQAASARDLCASCHTENQCLQCHGANVAALPSRMHFDDPQRADMHPTNFAARHAVQARTDPALCTTCHSVDSCQQCHKQQGLLSAGPDRASPHPAGWVGIGKAGNQHGMAARQDPMSCASCHGGSGEQLCVGCHAVGAAGGNPHPAGFSSSKPMSERPCRLCHTGGM